MRRYYSLLFLLLSALLPAGCAAPAEPVSTPLPAQTPLEAPVEAEIFAVSTESCSAEPLPSEAPTEIPTDAPTDTPAPTPDPYRAEHVTGSKTNAAFWYGEPTEALRARITGTSFPEDPKDCPVSPEDLRYVHLLYVDFDGAEHEGELLVHKAVADEVLEIFEALYDARYPLRSVRLVDDFGEPFNDDRSMAADNTSAFCCRRVTGSKKFSRHSYGAAIDVNPLENPYIRPDGSFAPPESEPYLDRSDLRPGMITEDDLCYRLFTAHGWSWGGHFKGEKDYQHFSKTIKGVTP